MATYSIYSSDGTTVRYTGAPKYHGVFGKPSYLEFSEIASPKPIAWAVGDYVDYDRTGFRYKLYSEPQVVKSATRNTAGDAFVYKNVQFYAATKDLEIALFRDMVYSDNLVHFSSIATVDTYEDVYGIADRIQANMDDFADGEWNITVVSTSDSDLLELLTTVQQFSLSDGTCLDALNEIYNLWSGIGWVYSVVNDVNTITLGRPNLQSSANTTPEFSYGHGSGLKVLTRSVSTKSDMATRVYAYGSDRNMPTRYYNNYSPVIKDYESVYIPHLMLPMSDWGTTGGYRDARLAYLEDSDAVEEYGLIPKILRFDGTGDLEEIYPSVTGMTISDIVDTTYPASGYDGDEELDVIVGVTNPTDNGEYTDDSEKVKYQANLTFTEVEEETTTKDQQEYVTLGLTSPIVDSEVDIVEFPIGRYIVDASAVGCVVTGANDYLVELPTAYMEVYVNDVLQTSVAIEPVVTRAETEYSFNLEKVTFTTSDSGVLKVYCRVEMHFLNRASSTTVTYSTVSENTVVPVRVEYSIGSTFSLTLRQLGFDINDMGGVLSDGLCTISMKTGLCAGRDFVVNACEYDEDDDTWVLTCQRQNDTSLMQYFPNSIYTIETGDQFVLVDLQMPPKYVTAAATRLHNAAYAALQRMCAPKRVFTPEVDSKEILLSSVTLTEGLYMPVYDADLIATESSSAVYTTWVLIDSVTISENESAIPIYSVTLRDTKAENMMQKITGELNLAQKRLRDIDMDKKRVPAVSDDDAVETNVLVGVIIETEQPFFLYTGDTDTSDTDTSEMTEEEIAELVSQKITLTARTSGINQPVYQWYYLGAEDWVALDGETNQAYIVLSESTIYYQDNEIVEDFMVVVTDGEATDDSTTYSDTIQITKLTAGITIALNNPAHIFEATDTCAVDGQTDTINVVAYNGITQVAATVNSISGQIDGAITAEVTDGTNGTTAPEIVISVTSSLTTASGELIINVTAAGVTRDLVYSWALAFQGEAGEDGYSSATIYLYQRFPTGTPSDYPVGDTVYYFDTDTLEVADGATLNGWEREISSGSGAIYVTMVHVSSNVNSVSLTGGWTTDSTPGAWSYPTRLTGEDGTNGRVMRGVNIWAEGGLSGGRPDGTTAGYQGINETTGLFYDVVAREDESTGKILSYYYCLDGSDGNAATIAPWEDGGDTYWTEATNFDFIATRVLLAENAEVDILSGNGVYMYDDAGSATGTKVAGIQGGSTVTYNGEEVIQVNIFAGGSEPQTAPFRVDSDGNVFMTSGSVGPFTLQSDGLIVDDWSYSYGSETHTVSVHYLASGFSASDTVDSTTNYVSLSPLPAVGLSIWDDSNSSTVVAGGIYTDGFIRGYEIYRTNTSTYASESVITMNESVGSLDAIYRVVHCTSDEYSAITSPDENTLYIVE